MAGTTVGGTHAELLAKRCMSGGPASWVIEQNSTVNTLANGSLATQATTGPQQLSTTVVQGDRINLTNAGWFHRNRCVRDRCVTILQTNPDTGNESRTGTSRNSGMSVCGRRSGRFHRETTDDPPAGSA